MFARLNFLLFIGGISLEAFILWRGWRERILVKYPKFYLYVMSLLICDPLSFAVYYLWPTSYEWWYWRLGLLNFLFVMGLLVEANRYCLESVPLARVFARKLQGIVIATIFVTASLSVYQLTKNSRMGYSFQRDFAVVQAILFLMLVGSIFYYGAPVGRNLKGILLGYGLALVGTLVAFSLDLRWNGAFYKTLSVGHALSFIASLIIWLAALWKYDPNPVVYREFESETAREAFVRRTKYKVDLVTSYFAKLVGS